MAKLTYLLLLLIVAVTLTQICEGRRRGGRKHRKRANPWGRHHLDSQRDARRNGRRHWGDSLRERIFGTLPRHHSFDFSWNENPFFSVGFNWNYGGGPEPWWAGPNICETVNEDETNSTDTGIENFLRHFMTVSRTCDETETAYRCKDTTLTPSGKREVTMVKQCCLGFTRKEDDFGCPQESEMKTLLEKAEDLGLTEFKEAVELMKLDKKLEEGNFTVFAPTNGAFGLDSNLVNYDVDFLVKDQPHVIMISEPGAEKAVESLQDAMLGHIVPGWLRTSDMEDEQVLETTSPEGSTIRINFFLVPLKVMTANCVPIESKDNMASNGVIHTLSKAMMPVTRSILDIVKSSPELSILKTMLAIANYVSKFDEEGSMTLLAPTNKAFDMMAPKMRERLLAGDATCLQKLLDNHLLPNVICASAVKGQAKTINLLNEYINMTRTEDDKLFADNAQLVSQDVMATNGVIHLIDAVLVPQRALGVMDVLRDEGHTELLDLMDKAGLTKSMDLAENITLFAPTKEAIKNLPDSIKTQLEKDPELLSEVLNFHTSPGISECHSFHDNDLLPTQAGSDIRLNIFHTYVTSFETMGFGLKTVKTAQCVPMSSKHKEACNGRVNVIEDVMLPPKGNVIDVLALDKKFSTLVSLIKQSGLADKLQEDGPFTIFAPNNEAFEKLNKKVLQRLAEDEEKLNHVLRGHIFPNTLCCAGIFKPTWFSSPSVPTMTGANLRLDKSDNGDIKVGKKAKVLTCDLTATNGNVLEIDQVLADEMRPSRWLWRRGNPGFRRNRWRTFEP